MVVNLLQSGNDRYDLERAEQQAKERARAHIKFEESSKAPKLEVDIESAQSLKESGPENVAKATNKNKKRRIDVAQETTPASETSLGESGVPNPGRKRKKSSKEKRTEKGQKST